MFDIIMDEVTYRIAQAADVENVFKFEFKRQCKDEVEEIENQIMVWNSYFRKEALEHYFKTGWSFLATDSKQEIKGFFMAQPLLFVEKQTQSLWVEYVSAVSDEIYTELVDIAYRLAREKHFQKVLFSDHVTQNKLIKNFDFKVWERNVFYLKTTK